MFRVLIKEINFGTLILFMDAIWASDIAYVVELLKYK